MDEKLIKQVTELLIKQGRGNIAEGVTQDFRSQQLRTMVEKNIDLVDMDRWNSIEKISKCKLPWDEACKLIDCFYELDIEVLDLVD